MVPPFLKFFNKPSTKQQLRIRCHLLGHEALLCKLRKTLSVESGKDLKALILRFLKVHN